MRNCLCSRDLSFILRWRMAKCYVASVLLYGAETWTLKTASINRLEAFEMWMIRRMLRIPWTDKVRNDYILEKNGICREILKMIKIRKTLYLGHLLRNPKYELLQLIMMGKVQGRRGVGRKKMSWLANIRKWTGISSASELFHVAQDREKFGEVVANLQ